MRTEGVTGRPFGFRALLPMAREKASGALPSDLALPDPPDPPDPRPLGGGGPA